MKDSANRVKLGIVGCSGYAFELIKRIWLFEGQIELIAAFSPDARLPEVAQCRKHGVRVFDDLDAFIDYVGQRADAVMNPTPIHRHKEISIRCIEAGLPVWLEKPPVATLAEWDELMEASRRYDKPVEVCFNALYLPAVAQIKARLLAGEFGPIRRIRGVGAWLRSEDYFTRSDWAGRLRLEGHWVLDGTINNPLAHLLCSCLYFAGGQPRSMGRAVQMEARLWHANAIDSEDTSSLRITTDTGVEIVTNMTLCARKMVVPQMVVDAEKARIVFNDFQDFEIIHNDGRTEHFPAARENRLDMLETLCRSLDEPGCTPCPLDVTRPFIEVVNRAFHQVLKQHNGAIPEVQASVLEAFGQLGKSYIGIADIDRLLLEAHHAGRLLELPAGKGQGLRLESGLIAELQAHSTAAAPTARP